MGTYYLINKNRLVFLAKGVYFSLGLAILYRFLFIDSADQGLITFVSFLLLGFPLSFIWSFGIFLPVFFIDLLTGGAVKALPDTFQVSLIALVCFASFCGGYYQWFVLVPRYVNRFIEVRLRKP